MAKSQVKKVTLYFHGVGEEVDVTAKRTQTGIGWFTYDKLNLRNVKKMINAEFGEDENPCINNETVKEMLVVVKAVMRVLRR